jgi:hypothetical protein
MAKTSGLPELSDIPIEEEDLATPLSQAPDDNSDTWPESLLREPVLNEEYWESFLRSSFRILPPSSPLPRSLVEETLEKIICEIGETFQVSIDLQDIGFKRACDILYEAMFAEPYLAPADSKEVIRHLKSVASHAKAVRPLLQFSDKPRPAGEIEARNALITSIYRREQGLSIVLSQLETLAQCLTHLEAHCAAAIETVQSHKIGKGLTWYEPFTRLMIRIALFLDIKVSTAGDRAGEGDAAPYATPFTTLVFGLERLLPKEAQSKKLSGCAKRIERTKAYRQFHDR